MKKTGFVFVLALTLTLLAATSHAIIEEKSSIVGSLLNQTNRPFSGVTVRLLDSFFLNEVAKTITDRDGNFELANLLPGLYLISIQPPGMPSVMKRIQVLSGTPTFIDVRPLLDEERMKSHSAWDSLKWTIRTAERNPLRDDQSVFPDDQSVSDEGLMAALRNFQVANNINGQVSYVNIGSGFSDVSVPQQSAQFAVSGQWEQDAQWSFRGNVLGGVGAARSSYSAAGDFEYELSDHRIGTTFAANDLLFARYPDLLDRQRITRFMRTPAGERLPDETRLWITSVDVNDHWRLMPKLQLSYGARIDYYGYLQDNLGYSPRVQLSYEAMPGISLHGVFFRNLSAPGNDYLSDGELGSLGQGVAFVPYTGSIEPEKTAGYEIGFTAARDGYQLGVFYETEDIGNKIATVDLSDSPVNDQLQSAHPFVIFNSTDLQSHGIDVNVGKRINRRVSAEVAYSVRQSLPVYIIEKRIYETRQLYFMEGDIPQFFHDVKAGIEARFSPSGTSLNAKWKWSSGSPLVFGRKEDNKPLSAIDVEVRQELPLRSLSQSQLQLIMAVRNLLDQNDEITSNADFQRALEFGMPRTIAGGVLLKF